VNAGRIEGGIKANVVASECQVLAGLRPGPTLEPAALLDELKGLAPRDVLESCELAFHGPALAERAEMRALAENAGISVADPVDFWTEAALFGAGGVPAMVLGPGHISQAHTAGEWVSYAHLSAAFAAYSRLLEAS
jgi:acetylornithine deacetylase